MDLIEVTRFKFCAVPARVDCDDDFIGADDGIDRGADFWSSEQEEWVRYVPYVFHVGQRDRLILGAHRDFKGHIVPHASAGDGRRGGISRQPRVETSLQDGVCG